MYRMTIIIIISVYKGIIELSLFFELSLFNGVE